MRGARRSIGGIGLARECGRKKTSVHLPQPALTSGGRAEAICRIARDFGRPPALALTRIYTCTEINGNLNRSGYPIIAGGVGGTVIPDGSHRRDRGPKPEAKNGRPPTATQEAARDPARL
jgi:hypothetical protein